MQKGRIIAIPLGPPAAGPAVVLMSARGPVMPPRGMTPSFPDLA